LHEKVEGIEVFLSDFAHAAIVAGAGHQSMIAWPTKDARGLSATEGIPMRHARAIRCAAFGAPEDLIVADVELPAPGPGQVRIVLRAAGVNFADYLIVAGKYQVKPALPFIPGLEAAGEIIELGPRTEELQLGQRVAVVTRPGGCFATGIVIDAVHAVPLPNGIDFGVAACMSVAYGTAHLALSGRGKLRAGETLLVTGAAGGVGLAAVEVGKALGARVIAAAGSRARLDLALARGADEIVDYGSESLRDRVKALTKGKGADVIFDPVGGDVFDQCLRAINQEGRILVVGFASGRIPSVPTNLVLIKNCSIVGVDFGIEMDGGPALRERLSEIFSWFLEGRFKPHISMRLPLEEAGAALRRLADRATQGRIALEM
jgi:NADPH2:quinone reductase